MIVIDAAAVVDTLTGVVGTEALAARIAAEELHAPALLDYEVVSALRGLTAGDKLSVTRATDALTDYADLAVERWPGEDALRRRAFALREQLGAYDAAYVALAEALDCPLVTRDGRLGRSRGHAATIEVL